MATFRISGNIVDIIHKTIFPGTIWVESGHIQAIEPEAGQRYSQYILPGFIDAHIHLESSMLVPSEFARLATVHGTVAVVSDPHEIANVLGLAGVRFMTANAAQTPFTIACGAPSCVPATTFETAGASLLAEQIQELFEHREVSHLSEVMNVPGVLLNDPMVMAKIKTANQLGYPIDGHAPGLRGEAVQHYATYISTDHECCSLAEAEEKIAAGMKILIREGSAAKNYDALHTLIDTHPDCCMFCSDDKHPNDLVQGHINQLVRRSIARGHDVMKVLQVACVNPVQHYRLPVGLLQKGDPADLIMVNNLQAFEVQSTYCKGILVAKEGKPLLDSIPTTPINQFAAVELQPTDFQIPAQKGKVRVIEVIDGQLITLEQHLLPLIQNNEVVADLKQDILKLAVINRYIPTAPALALIHNFGLKQGAIASSVAHDSHNIIAVGTSDRDLCAAVNAVILNKGGIALAIEEDVQILPLPVAGLMSDADGYQVAAQYAALDRQVKQLGSSLTSPFMTLSFMALLVIPDLKLSDRGLFNSKDFQFVSLWVDEDGS